MKFDKSRIYTAVNADEVKIGSKGYLGDSLLELTETVESEDKKYYGEIKKIMSTSCPCRFVADSELNSPGYLFYLVEDVEDENKEPIEINDVYRPYKDTNEMVADFLERYNALDGNVNAKNPMYKPLIWLRDKCTRQEYLIVSFNSNQIVLVDTPISIPSGTIKLQFDMRFLLENFNYLDGSPCGKLMKNTKKL